MEERPVFRIPGPVIAGAILAMVAILYVGGYFGLCEEVLRPGSPTATGKTVEIRIYLSAPIAGMYRPAAFVESLVTGKRVLTGSNTA